MMPSGQTGDANEGSPQIPHSFERHTTALFRGVSLTPQTHTALHQCLGGLGLSLTCISPESLMECARRDLIEAVREGEGISY